MATEQAEHNLEFFLSLEYKTLVSCGAEITYVYAPDLNLLAEGSDPNEACEKFFDQKRRLFERLTEIGQAASIPLPQSVREKIAIRHSLTPFLIRAAVVALIGVLFIVAANVSILYTLRESPKHAAQVAARYAARKLVSEFSRLTPAVISPEREQKIRSALRAAMPTLKSLSRELSPLWDCPQKELPKALP